MFTTIVPTPQAPVMPYLPLQKRLRWRIPRIARCIKSSYWGQDCRRLLEEMGFTELTVLSDELLEVTPPLGWWRDPDEDFQTTFIFDDRRTQRILVTYNSGKGRIREVVLDIL